MLSLQNSAERMRCVWDDPARRYPTLVYVETTNYCNARCKYCLWERMERPVEWMTQEQFEWIADKVKARGLKIGAMFCFGEPLADRGLFDKIRYGRSIGVMTDYLGLNTNVSLLTPDKFADVLDCTSNITLSFVTTGAPFELLTGLNYQDCYTNAIEFIEYRDKVQPEYQIEIGCNDVTGHDRARVQKAFAGYRVDWARDAEIKWGENIIDGIIDRSIMYHHWTCDGHKGAMQIKPNGDLCFCAYDVVRSETRFGNIFTDSWDAIEAQFKSAWRAPSTLCQRCDFWHNYFQCKEAGFTRGPHIDESWKEQYQE